MSVETRTISEPPKLKLFKSGVAERLIDFAMADQTFVEVARIDATGLSPEKVTILVLGDYQFGNAHYIVTPNSSAFVTTTESGTQSALDGGYQYVDDTIILGIVQDDGGTITPIAPYSTARILYTILYY